MIPTQNQTLQLGYDRILENEYDQNNSSDFSSQEGFQEDYQLIPRQEVMKSLRADSLVDYRSQPFVYKARTAAQLSPSNDKNISNSEDSENRSCIMKQQLISKDKQQLQQKSDNQVRQPSQSQFCQQSSGEKLARSMQQIEVLRRQLLKSTQNNIRTIFDITLTSQQCQVAQLLDAINKKMIQLSIKVQTLEQNRVKQLQFQLDSRRRKSHHQQQSTSKNQFQTNRNMIVLDLGQGSVNQGNVVTIYPRDTTSSVEKLTFGHDQTRQNYPKILEQTGQKESMLSVMIATQQSFLGTLKDFQKQFNSSISQKLQQFKHFYTQNEKNRLIQLQKLQRQQKVSQQKRYRYDNEDEDDSRGSINVIYIKRLRELEEHITEKQTEIERLKSENYYLGKQVQKIQRLHQKLSKNHELIQYRLSPLNPIATQENYSFQNNNLNIKQSISQPNNSRKQATSKNKEQEIKQPTILNHKSTNFIPNFQQKKKNTHSFHHYESKAIQSTQLIELRDKLSQFELLLKQKDLRIRELQNTIMDHLQSSRKCRQSEEKRNSREGSAISGYSSPRSSENSPELLHMKIKNLKTLVKQANKQTIKYKKLYQTEKANNFVSYRQVKAEVTGLEDLTSNTSRSLCVSDRMTGKKNEILLINDRNFQDCRLNSPFEQLMQQTSIPKQSPRHSQCETKRKENQQISSSGVSMVNALVNFIMMAWSLKQVILKFCGSEVDVQKINRNARQFLAELKVSVGWSKVLQKLQDGELDKMIKFWIQ